MKATYETGHAKNVANFETLIAFITGYGPLYNPSNPAIQLNALQAKALEVKTASDNLKSLLTASNQAVAIRDAAFAPLMKLSTRILNALKATTASQAIIENAISYNRKLQGVRVSKMLTEEEKLAKSAAGEKIVNQISASQLGFDSRLDTFDKQVKLLSTIAEYTPNEDELKIESLANLYTVLHQCNERVTAQSSALSTGRLLRNEIFYDKESGMVVLAYDAKNYVKSIFGTTHQRYKQISGIRFKLITP